MKRMLTLVLAMLIAASASAITDPTPNLMGFYFDYDADVPCVENIAPYAQLPMYMVITNLTADALYGFEAGYDIDGPAMVLNTEFANPSIIDVGQPGNHIVGYGSPTPAAAITMLATLTVMNTSTDGTPTYFFIHGTTPSSIDPQYPVILLADGELQSVPVTNYYEGITSLINGVCYSATDEVSIDGIKSLYR